MLEAPTGRHSCSIGELEQEVTLLIWPSYNNEGLEERIPVLKNG